MKYIYLKHWGTYDQKLEIDILESEWELQEALGNDPLKHFKNM